MKKIPIITFIIFTVLNLIIPDALVSKYENRKLATFPTLSWDEIIQGTFQEELREYLSDQIAFRDAFRKLVGFTNSHLLEQIEMNDGFYIDGETYYKFTDDAYDFSKLNSSNINDISKYFSGQQYVSLIPVKTHNSITFNIDQQLLLNSIYSDLEIPYIDLLDLLDDDFYLKTDPHWTMTGAKTVYEKIIDTYGKTYDFDYEIMYDQSPFYGTLYSMTMQGKPDYLEFYTNEAINDLEVCINTGIEIKCESNVYFDNQGYNQYLDGNHPMVEIYNENGEGEIVIFSDSFSNSIAPFFAQNYEKVTLVDFRLMRFDYFLNVEDSMNFDSDVLFLYNLKSFREEGALTN